MRKNYEEIDPVARAARFEEREKIVESLFHPIYDFIKDQPMEWIVPGLLPRSYLCVLASDPKEGKTALATALALAVATGTPFAGMPTNQSSVLWLSAEEGPAERHLLLQTSPLADHLTPLYTCYDHLPVDTEEGLGMLRNWVSRTNAALIVVDPLHGAQSGRSLGDGWAARKTLQRLKRFCAENRVAALVLHHAANQMHRPLRRRVAESAQLAATASMDIVLRHRPLQDFEAQTFGSASPLPCFESAKNEGGAGGGRSGTQDSAHFPASTDPSVPPPSCKASVSSVPSMVKSEPNAPTPYAITPSLPRLLTLSFRGRGAFANRILHLLSRGPLDYTCLEEAPFTSVKADQRDWVESLILDVLSGGTKTVDQLTEKINVDGHWLRSALTNLRRQNLVRVTWSNRQISRFGLTAAAKELFAREKQLELQKSPGSKEPKSCLKVEVQESEEL